MSAGRPARLVFLPNDHTVIFLGSPASEKIGPEHAVPGPSGVPRDGASWQVDAARRLGLPPGCALNAQRVGSFFILSLARAPGADDRLAGAISAQPPALSRVTSTAGGMPAASPNPAPESGGRALRARVGRRSAVLLTPEQRQVYQLLRLGLTDRQIGARLRRQRRWVCYRVAELKRAMGVKYRAELMRLSYC